jgi:small subunit ribosomal protein S5
MTDTKDTKEKVETKEAVAEEVKAPETNDKAVSNNGEQNGAGAPRVFKKNRRRGNKRRERQRSEFDQKILDIRRVTRVSAGGRRFSFAVSIAIGDRKGRMGVGTGKAGDTALAIEKATRNAKKNLITVKITENNSIPHEVKAKYCSARVMLMPAKGRGVIAGSAVRDLINLAGLNDINAKIISGTKNKLNIAQATVKALKSLKDPKNPKKVVKKPTAGSRQPTAKKR